MTLSLETMRFDEFYLPFYAHNNIGSWNMEDFRLYCFVNFLVMNQFNFADFPRHNRCKDNSIDH